MDETTKRTTLLVSPLSGKPLAAEGEYYATADGGERYPAADGIIDLLVDDLLDDAARHEIESFQTNPTVGTCYFRRSVFAKAAALLRRYAPQSEGELRFAELGGGEGYLARHIAGAFQTGSVYVCDISRRSLQLAPESLHRVCCDVRLPIFQEGGLDAAAFWVSLHHFSPADARRCLQAAAAALRPGGVLMLFEPNRMFLPRRVMMRLKTLRRKVYCDSEEKHLRLDECLELARSAGLAEIRTHFINPPYARPFIKKLNAGVSLFLATESLRLCDCVGISAVMNGLCRLVGARGGWGMYFLTLLRKTESLDER